MSPKRRAKKPMTASDMGKRGGKSRMAQLSPQARTALARRAALARWRKPAPPA